MLNPVVLGAAVALVAANVAVTWIVFGPGGPFARRIRSGVGPESGLVGGDREGEGEAHVRPEAGEVDCPECDATNELGYRFCRQCVGHLPGSSPFARAGGPPAGRFVR